MATKEDIKNDLVEFESGVMISRIAYLHNSIISICKKYNIMNEHMKSIECSDASINYTILKQLYNCKRILEKPDLVLQIPDIIIKFYIIEDELNSIIKLVKTKSNNQPIQKNITDFITFFQQTLAKINQINISYATFKQRKIHSRSTKDIMSTEEDSIIFFNQVPKNKQHDDGTYKSIIKNKSQLRAPQITNVPDQYIYSDDKADVPCRTSSNDAAHTLITLCDVVDFKKN